MSIILQKVVPRESEVFEESDVPEGWTGGRLPQTAEIIMGQSPPGSTYNEQKNGLPFFQGKADFGERYPTPRVWCTSPNKIAEAGDVLISVRAPVGPTNVAKETCAIGRGLAAIRPLGGIASEFILFSLRLKEPELSLSGTGSTFTAISRRDIDEITIDIPPPAEQKRIVARIEELFAQVNAARARLAKVRLTLKRFRQAILAAACSEGEPLPLSEFVLDIKYGTAQKCTPVPIGSPVLRIPNIGDGSVRLDDLKYAKLPAKELAALRLAPGDILMIRSNGSVSLVGKPALVSEREAGFAYAGYLIRLRADRNRVLPQYLNLALQTHSVREQIEIPARSTSGVHNINSTEVLSLKINLPDLNVQRAAVRRVEALFKLADVIEKRVDAAMKSADKLTQAILAKAFRGELVPTEAELARREGRDYEPASVLLARIRSEREAKQVTPRANGKPKARSSTVE
jgi:type I restriction enzyme S subunit